MEELKNIEEHLFELRLSLSKLKMSKPWTRFDLNKVLLSLNKNKARDPWGLSNLIFKPEVAGEDLLNSISIMNNKIKKYQHVPDFFLYGNITSLCKNKGERADLNND